MAYQNTCLALATANFLAFANLLSGLGPIEHMSPVLESKINDRPIHITSRPIHITGPGTMMEE